jgi:hypothetical protein
MLALATGSAMAANYVIVVDKMTIGALPAELHVGDTITWKNNDLFRHTATARVRSEPALTATPVNCWRASTAGLLGVSPGLVHTGAFGPKLLKGGILTADAVRPAIGDREDLVDCRGASLEENHILSYQVSPFAQVVKIGCLASVVVGKYRLSDHRRTLRSGCSSFQASVPPPAWQKNW